MGVTWHLFDQNFWVNFVLAMTMQWFWTIWIGEIRPQNWSLPVKWVLWALIPAVIGEGWSLTIPPLAALVYLLRHHRNLALIFMNATIVIFLIVVLVNDFSWELMRQLWGDGVAQSVMGVASRLTVQLMVYSLISLSVVWMHIQPGNLDQLALSHKEQWTVLALLLSLSSLVGLSSTIIHHMNLSQGMLTFSLGIEVLMIGLIVVSLFIFLRSFMIRQRVKSDYQTAMLQSRYDRRISDQVQNIRDFKRTYQDQMLRLGDYLDAEDYEGLERYYQTLNTRWQTTNQLAGLEIDGLQRLNDPPLKNLLFQKILAAQQHHWHFRLEVPDPIQMIPMNNVQLLRVLGILLDNAIEAPLEGELPEIYCAILDYPDAVELAVANPVSVEHPPAITQFMRAGYTTKGGGHGLGLSTVQEIIDQTPNASLQIMIKRHHLYFTIILTKTGGE